MTFSELAVLGYGSRLIPIIPPQAEISERSHLLRQRIEAGEDPRGKMPGVRWPDGKWSGFDWRAHQTIESDLPRWERMGAGAGIKLDDGLVAIDADTLKEDIAALIKHEIERHIGKTPVRIGRYPKALYLIRVAAPYRYARVEFGLANGRPRERVEILSSGRQFVATGVHPKTMEPYRWPRGVVALGDLPLVEPAALDALMDALRSVLPDAGPIAREGVGPGNVEIIQEKLKGDPPLVAAALAAMANTTDKFPSRESYLSVGYRLKAALADDPDLAFSLFASWCAAWRDPDGRENDPAIVAGDWARMRPPFRRGAESLYRLAEDVSGGVFNAVVASHFEVPPADNKPAAGLETVTASSLFGLIVPEQQWLVRDLIPANNVTLLGGDGGTGKSLLALQLAEAVATGRSWLGLEVAGGRALYLSAEDELDELHRRTNLISADMEKLDGLIFAPLAGKEAILAAPSGKDGLLKPTELFGRLRASVALLRPTLLVLDTLADIFGGDEIKKLHARSFTSLLRGLALEFGITVVLLYHPSLTGMASGTGTSGNVGWGNSVRSRLYLNRILDASGGERDANARVLIVKKANRSAAGLEIPLRWAGGLFRREGSVVAAHDPSNEADRLFLQILASREREDRPVSHKQSAHNYAPRIFAGHPDAERMSVSHFEQAMERLFKQGLLQVVTYKRDSKTFVKIGQIQVVSDDGKSDSLW